MSGTDLLDGFDLAALPGASAREAAAARLRAGGWPTRRDEAWHYTDLAAGLRGFALGPAPAVEVAAELPEGQRVVFVNGRFDAARSTAPDWVGRLGGAAADTARGGVVVALNTALAEDGVAITLAPGQQGGTLFLLTLAAGRGETMPAIAPRHRIALGAGATLTLIETARGEGSYLHAPVFEVELGEGARLNHYRLQDESGEAVHVATVFAEIAGGAGYESFTLNRGARLSRNETHARLTGPAADVHLNAAQLLNGTQHGDVTTVVRHDAPDCASRQTVKSVLAGAARGVFQGRIEVDRIAQKTDGYQMNQALLLSDEAEIDSKPELEIFADDVKCSHGATIGALDPEQLFYLRSRGVPAAEAKSILIRAFLDEALEPVTDEAARAVFEAAIGAWWREGA